jgi:D-glycero-D-manno-heptose 1,7-bisphosphate phosphatase
MGQAKEDMKAVFVHKNCVLRDSRVDPESPPDGWRLVPATLEAMRLLATDNTLVFLYGRTREPMGTKGEQGHDPAFDALVSQIKAGGGRVDGTIACPHDSEMNCHCWGDFPGILWVPANQFGLHLEDCYVLADNEQNVNTAYAAGARPLVVLCGRTIGEIFGDRPSHKDYPIAVDMTTAVGYIGVEEDIAEQIGQSRNPAPALPPEEELLHDPEVLPRLTLTSELAEGLHANLLKTRFELRDIGRWLTFFVMGAVGLSLGIAYLLTHLYRVAPFPEYAYYITLQFIPRPVRGALFIIWGVGILVLAVRSFYRSNKLHQAESK